MRKKLLLFFIFIQSVAFTAVYGLEINNEDIDVIVGEIAVPTYKVDIVWGAMNFNYNEQVNYSWDDVTHTYIKNESIYQWQSSDNNINITNNSLKKIKVEFEYIGLNEQIFGEFNKNIDEIETGIKKNYELNLSGIVNQNNFDYVRVGFIQLKIS